MSAPEDISPAQRPETVRRGRGRPRKNPAPPTPEAHPEEASRPEPMTGRELSKMVKVMEQAARQAGAILQGTISGDPAGQWRIANLLKQEYGENTAQIAVLMVLPAMAQTPASSTISPDSMIRRWREELEEGNPDDFKPILPLAAGIMETVNGADPYTAGEMTGVLQDTAERIRDTLPGNDPTGTAMQKLMSNRKKLANYHTKPGAAALMAHLNQYQGGMCISGVLKTTERTPRHLISPLGPKWVVTDSAV